MIRTNFDDVRKKEHSLIFDNFSVLRRKSTLNNFHCVRKLHVHNVLLERKYFRVRNV